MTITKKLENGVLTAALDGWLNAVTSNDFNSSLSELGGNVKTLILDFDKLQYMSSAGIRDIIELSRTCDRLGIELRMINAGHEIIEVFHITRLDTRFNITPKADQNK